jgi:hypothetical protein
VKGRIIGRCTGVVKTAMRRVITRVALGTFGPTRASFGTRFATKIEGVVTRAGSFDSCTVRITKGLGRVDTNTATVRASVRTVNSRIISRNTGVVKTTMRRVVARIALGTCGPSCASFGTRLITKIECVVIGAIRFDGSTVLVTD